MHKKCHIGQFCEGKTEIPVFPLNEEGEYNENGTYDDESAPEALQVKYPKEACFGLGVAHPIIDGKEAGTSLLPFDYSKCTIINIKEENELIEKEIVNIKSKDRLTKAWTSNPNGVDCLYFDDELLHVVMNLINAPMF